MGVVDEVGGHYIRVRVLIDISLPLCQGRLITMENGRKIRISFKYERLLNFCFWCGRLNHSDKNCELWIESKGTLTLGQQQFNSTLRVAPYTSAGKDVIYILGYYERSKPRARVEFHGVQSQSSSLVRAGEGGSLVVVQSVERVIERSVDGEALMSVDGIREGEALNNNCVDMEGTLQPNQEDELILDSISTLSPPINAPNFEEVNMESEYLIPNSGSEQNYLI